MNRDEQLAIQLQNLRLQLQNILVQKENLKMQKVEAENALKSIKQGDEIYKVVGALMVRKNYEEIRQDLKERIEMGDVMIASLEKKEKALLDKIKELESSSSSAGVAG